MNLNEMKNHHIEFCNWLESLKDIDQTKWEAPVAEGKWSVGAVIGHILFWDRHSIKERFPHFIEGAKLPGYPDFQGVNDAARDYVQSDVSKEVVINELLQERKSIIQRLHQYSEEDLLISFEIGGHPITIGEYFRDFISHDLHHQNQIISVLSQTTV